MGFETGIKIMGAVFGLFITLFGFGRAYAHRNAKVEQRVLSTEFTLASLEKDVIRHAEELKEHKQTFRSTMSSQHDMLIANGKQTDALIIHMDNLTSIVSDLSKDLKSLHKHIISDKD